MKYETVIGLEVHTELSTKTKIFCACTTEFGGEPNSHVCEICSGMPGTLPMLNRAVVEYAVRAGLALNCEITAKNKFDRKNYFYPDLPKAYQISQLYLPICRNGYIEINSSSGGKKKVHIREIHMEEDAGKLIHCPEEGTTLVDYNRCGVPLLEIVSEPDIRTAEEAIEYLEKLRAILQYIGVSDCKMQEGSLRADINLSVRPESSEEFGVRTEMKNMNSFRAISRAVESEGTRQIKRVERGDAVHQETRRWDDDEGESFSMRSKEDAQDYKYFPEPDIPPIELDSDFTEKIKAELPELPEAKKLRYVSELGLSEYDAEIVTGSVYFVKVFEKTAEICGDAKEAAKWVMGELLMHLKDSGTLPENMTFDPAYLGKIINLMKAGKINRGTAKKVFSEVFASNTEPEKYIRDNGLMQITDSDSIRETVEKVIADNEKSVADYKNGKTQAFQYLVGQSMRALKGRAPANEVSECLRELLSELSAD